MFPNSIRWRMQLWQGFLLLCVLSGFGVTAYQLQRINRMGMVDEELKRRIIAVSGDLRWRFRPGEMPGPMPFGPGEPPGPRPFRPGEPTAMEPFGRFEPWRREGHFERGRRGGPDEWREARLSARTLSLFGAGDRYDYYYVIWSRSGGLIKSSTNSPPELVVPGWTPGDTTLHTRTRELHREGFQFTPPGDCLLVGCSIKSELSAMRQFAWLLGGAGAMVLGLGLGGGWWLSSRALRPVEDISSAAKRIAEGNLSQRINVEETESELGRLAGVLNSTFARLEAAFAQQKQFTADASHELRTPIAVLIAETQTSLARERTAAEYRETVQACLETAQQMRSLTQALLALARYDAGEEAIERKPLDLADQARDCIDLVHPLAKENGIRIESTLDAAKTTGNPERLNEVITNLLTNAIYYNQLNGEVRVRTATESETVVLQVEDTGQGICKEDLPHIFKRFYRADKSRGRQTGCSGLGLAICKAIVLAHGGTIEVTSEIKKGTTFTVKLPK